MSNPTIIFPRVPDTHRYFSLIESRKAERSTKPTFFSEKHHIIPKCLGGLDDEKNLVWLTPREHWLAHKLLLKIFPNEPKIQQALWMMSHTRGLIKSSREYEFLRCKCQDGLKTNLGKNFSEIHRAKIGLVHRGKVVSEETREKLRQKALGRKLSEEAKTKCAEASKLSKGFSGKSHSEESKAKTSASLKGLKWWHKNTDGLVEKVRSRERPDETWSPGAGKFK